MRLGAWLFVLSFALVASVGHAQLDEGRRRLEQADFTRAVRAFDRAERQAHLTREDLLAIYEGRAMARWAQGNERQAEHDLALLAEIDAQHTFPPEAPPELGEAFAEAARSGALSIELSFVDTPGAVTLSVDTHHDQAGIVRSLRTHVRIGASTWGVFEESTIPLEVPEGDIVAAWVEAIGPGGAILATNGSEDAPVSHGGEPVVEAPLPPPVVAVPPPAPIVAPVESHDDSGLWIGLGIGIGVLVVAGVIVGIVLGTSQGPSDQTQPDAPVVRF